MEKFNRVDKVSKVAIEDSLRKALLKREEIFCLSAWLFC